MLIQIKIQFLIFIYELLKVNEADVFPITDQPRRQSTSFKIFENTRKKKTFGWE